ncbi:hypothetical protein HK097_001147 [Rhizophlyctis rosea]|uniref:Queuosine 5'-phosphate N-glycosylase/hydrolase n=1 Tax=Rhizophlyctis rosea TaxID=64517 RepID=A0AAD5SG86_9FUNG|nr:hypothetical protein HK097_001147 [Rhizophlyctis rosea]
MPAPSTTDPTSAPLPPPGTFLQTVRNSSYSLRSKNAPEITINEDAIEPFLQQINVDQWKTLSTRPPLVLPLKFDSPEQEINFVGLVEFLTIGSAWNHELQQYLNTNNRDVILFGLLSLHLSSMPLTASFFRSISLSDIANYFNIPLQRELQHPTLPMTLTEPHPIKVFAELLQTTMNELGAALEEKGHKDLGAYLLNAFNQAGSATKFVESLNRTFSTLQDATYTPSHPIYIFSRAQRIAHTLHQSFPSKFPFPDVSDLTVCITDSTIPSFLASHGILHADKVVLEALKDSSHPEAKYLIAKVRAATLDGCLAIVRKAKEVGAEGLQDMNGEGLDAYLWGVVKDKAYSDRVQSSWWTDNQCKWY